MAAFTATVTANAPSTATPTGTVSFFDGTDLLGISTLLGGLATFNTSALGVGLHDITGTYNGSTDFTASPASNTVTQQIDASTETLSIVSGGGNTGTVGTAPPALVVKLVDQYGYPIVGEPVSWAAATGGGSVGTPVTITNSSGQASVTAFLGTTAGTNNDTYTASVGGAIPSTVTFTETANAGAAKDILLVSGNNQTGTVGTALSASIVAEVTDQYGNPISGYTVTWAAASGGGSVGSSSPTGANGQTLVTATLGTIAGERHLHRYHLRVGRLARHLHRDGHPGQEQRNAIPDERQRPDRRGRRHAIQPAVRAAHRPVRQSCRRCYRSLGSTEHGQR